MKKSLFYAFLTIIVFFHGARADEAKLGTPDKLSINLTGGISGGFYFSNNIGSNNYDENVAVSNILFTFSLEKDHIPLSFEGGFGGTSASSLLEQSLDITPQFDIEFADFTITPADYFNFEIGLLQPSSGYEDTYTLNNKNCTVGILASQQPFNATGIRGNFSIKGISAYAGFYKDRLDNEEYSWGTTTPTVSYEIGISGNIMRINLSFYHYHINNIRNLTGLIFEKDFNQIYIGLNIDYWRWSNNIVNMKGKSSIGGAVYFSKSFENMVILPFRFEYINQGQSRIYIDSDKVSDIFSLTFTPTYYFSEDMYARYEIGYIYTNNGFTANVGGIENKRVVSSVEVGVKF